MFLEEIIDNVHMESAVLECKARLNREDMLGWLKSVAGFANAFGGDLFLGVEDKTNKLIGFRREEADSERNYFNNAVNEHIVPRPIMSISFVPYPCNQSERFIIRVHIKESELKPVILKYKNVPSIYMRRDGFTNGATYEEIIEMSINSKKTQYDVLPSQTRYEADQFTLLRSFYSKHNDGKQLSEKALSSMGFYDENQILLNGALLFSDGYQGTKTSVQCCVFSSFHKGGEKIVTINRYHGNLIETLNSAMEFVNQRMNHALVKLENGRKNLDAYPKRALFEGLINAIAHRDYYLDGTQIQIDMFIDRLEISSPGSFYRGQMLSKTYDLSGIISKRRNELISNVLVRCNVMEAAGTGFDKIVEDYRNADESHRPYIFSSSDHFTLVLPDLTYADGVCESNFPPVRFIPAEKGSIYDEKLLSFCFHKAHKASEIAEHLNLSDSGYFRKQVLDNLVRQGYLEKSKLRRAAYYKTNRERVEEI